MTEPKNELVLVTPAIAEGWLNHANYERQRKRADWQVQRLAMEMEAGRFIVGSQIHFGVLNGRLKLVNGQHTLAAIVKSGVPIELTVLYTTVADEKELGQLYGRHDRHRGRTPHDGFLGMGLSAEIGLEEVEVNAFAPALKWILTGFRRPSVSNHPELGSLDYMAEEMTKWGVHARIYFDCVRDARHGMKAAYRRAPVVAVGIATVRYKKDRAREFWSGAVADDGLHKLDPRRALNQFLAQNSSGYGDPVIYMRNIAGAWNKFYENGELQFLRPGDSGKVGVTIRGTPFKAAKLKSAVNVGPADIADPPSPRPTQGELGESRV